MEQTSQQFQRAYAKFLAIAWTDPDFLKEAEKDIFHALKESGVSLVSHATVKLLYPTGKPDLKLQTEAWIKGNETGQYEFVVPLHPPKDMISNPKKISPEDIDCCCCCPSCSSCA